MTKLAKFQIPKTKSQGQGNKKINVQHRTFNVKLSMWLSLCVSIFLRKLNSPKANLRSTLDVQR
jgi:hypothetical protein